MGQPIKLGTFLVSLFGLLLTVSVMIYGKGSDDARNNNRLDFLELQMVEMKQDQKARDDKNDARYQKLDEGLNQILIILQNKQDRK